MIKTIKPVSLFVLFLLLVNNSYVCAQLTSGNPAYPIIFVHGWIGSDEAYSDIDDSNEKLADLLATRLNISPAKVYHACTNHDQNIESSNLDDDVRLIGWTNINGQNIININSEDRLFILNLKNDRFPDDSGDNCELSNQSGIYKSGMIIQKMIRDVLEATSMDKVILVGHSMGGLKIREYLQRKENEKHIWWAYPDDPNGHRVARVVTIGTPHLGSNTGVGPFRGDLYVYGVNVRSEAVRDLRWEYSTDYYSCSDTDNGAGLYLFGGNEGCIPDFQNPISMGALSPFEYKFYNRDVNCNGNNGDEILGINSGNPDSPSTVIDNPIMPLPNDIYYTWIISCIQNVEIGNDGDGIVSIDRQLLHRLTTNNSIITLPDNDNSRLVVTNTQHLAETDDLDALICGLDQTSDDILFFNELKFNQNSGGFFASNIRNDFNNNFSFDDICDLVDRPFDGISWEVDEDSVDIDKYKLNTVDLCGLKLNFNTEHEGFQMIQIISQNSEVLYESTNNNIEEYINFLTNREYVEIRVRGFPSAETPFVPYFLKVSQAQDINVAQNLSENTGIQRQTQFTWTANLSAPILCNEKVYVDITNPINGETYPFEMLVDASNSLSYSFTSDLKCYGDYKSKIRLSNFKEISKDHIALSDIQTITVTENPDNNSCPVSDPVPCTSDLTLADYTANTLYNDEAKTESFARRMLGDNYGVGTSGDVSSEFLEIRETTCNHKGLDMKTNRENLPVYSPVSGKVVAIGGTTGKIVIYNDAKDFTFVSLHHHTIDVGVGNTVEVGTRLGLSGAVGAVGIHIHAELRPGSRTAASETCGSFPVYDPRILMDIFPDCKAPLKLLSYNLETGDNNITPSGDIQRYCTIYIEATIQATEAFTGKLQVRLRNPENEEYFIVDDIPDDNAVGPLPAREDTDDDLNTAYEVGQVSFAAGETKTLRFVKQKITSPPQAGYELRIEVRSDETPTTNEEGEAVVRSVTSSLITSANTSYPNPIQRDIAEESPCRDYEVTTLSPAIPPTLFYDQDALVGGGVNLDFPTYHVFQWNIFDNSLLIGNEISNRQSSTNNNTLSSIPVDLPVDIRLSTDGGITYPTVIENNFVGNEYTWQVPDISIPDSLGKIKIELDTDPTAFHITEAFSIDNATLATTATGPSSTQFTLTNFNGPPSNGDDRYYGNQIYTIAWNSSIAPQGLVTIDLSTNCGASFDHVIATNILSDVEQYQWQVPNTFNTAQGMIRITFRSIPPAAFREETDFSDACFVIEPQQINAFAPIQIPQKCPSEGFDITFPYYVNKGFLPGTEFIVELSDETGGFGNLTELCRKSETGTGSITCAAPTNIVNGGNYKFRIRSTAVSVFPEVVSVTQDIDFFPAPAVDITYTEPIAGDGVLRACDQLILTASDDGSATGYTWRMNGAVIPNQNNKTLVVTTELVASNIGINTFTVVANNSQGCTRTSEELQVEIIPSVKAFYSADDYQTCVLTPITFTDTSAIPTGATNVTKTWLVVETGETQTGDQAIFDFELEGSYTVRLNVTTNEGCDDEIEKTIQVSAPPTTTVSALNNTNICEGDTAILVTNAVGGNSPLSYQWYRGNDKLEGETRATLFATEAGDYWSVTANSGTDTCSKSSENRVQVTVSPQPTANYTLTTYDTCTNSDIGFLNTSQQDSPPTANLQYQWDFGDNRTSGIEIPGPLSYPTGGVYTTRLIVISDDGCADTLTRDIEIFDRPIASISSDALTGCSKEGVWVYANVQGNDTSAYTYQVFNGLTPIPTANNASYLVKQSGTYRFVVSTRGSEVCETETAEVTITIEQSPTTSISASDNDVCTDELLIITSNTVASATATRVWQLGDGRTSSATELRDIDYPVAGEYEVILTVTDNACIVSDTITIKVSDRPQFTLETVDNLTTVCSADLERFQLYANVLGNELNTYQWFRNDVLMTGEDDSTLSITLSGEYRLEVTNPSNCMEFATVNIVVEPSPTTSISASENEVCTDELLTMTSNTVASATAIQVWQLGDGRTSSATELRDIDYPVAGDYEVILTVIDHGCEASDTIIVKVSDRPQFTLETVDNLTTVCSADLDRFQLYADVLGNELNTYEWFRDDVLMTGEDDSTLSISSSGEYRLEVTNPSNCMESATINIIVESSPTTSISASDNEVCTDELLTITSSTVASATATRVWQLGDGRTSSATEIRDIDYPVAGDYRVILTVTDHGCEASDTITIKVSDRPQFTLETLGGRTIVCSAELAEFQLYANVLGNELNTYQWFRNEVLMTGEDDSTLRIDTSGGYRLEVTNPSGCTEASATISITVNESPVAVATVSDTIICTDEAIAFTNGSGNASDATLVLDYFWDFDDDRTSAQEMIPVFSYPIAGSYTPTLVVNTATGCADTVSLPTIVVNDRPIISISSNLAVSSGQPNLICTKELPVELTVNIQGKLADHTIEWFKDDVSIPNEFNPLLTIKESGHYRVEVMNIADCITASAEYDFQFQESPVAGFIAPLSVCVGEVFDLINTSTIDNDPNVAMDYLWIIEGNGTGVERDITEVVYDIEGTYEITMIVTNPTSSCTDTSKQTLVVHPLPFVKITPTGSIPFCPNTGATMVFKAETEGTGDKSFRWTRDGVEVPGARDSLLTVTEEGMYIAYVINHSISSDCENASVPVEFIISDLPEFDFIYSTPICLNQEAIFQAEFTDTDLTLIGYFFEDGGIEVLPTARHTFSTTGFHEVSLVMENVAGCRDTVTQEVFVNLTPTARFDAVQEQCFGTITEIENLSENASLYQWIFGDGDTSFLPEIDHFYEEPGVYNLILIVTSESGCKDTMEQTIVINELPEVAFNILPNCQDLTFEFENQTTSSAIIIATNWDFGDGTTSTDVNPSHTFPQAGIYTVTLTQRDINQCVSQKDSSFYVGPVMVADFSHTTSCEGKEFILMDESTVVDSLIGEIESWQWQVGDSLFSTEQHPTFIINGTGDISVVLTITSEEGCVRQIEREITIYENPIAGIAMSKPDICIDKTPFVLELTNTSSTDAIIFNWLMPDGSEVVIENPNYTITTVGEHEFRLVVQNGDGCTDTVTSIFTVYDSIDAEFFVSNIDNIGCGDHTYTFTNTTSTDAIAFNWFVDGVLQSSDRDFIYTFERLDSVNNEFEVMLEAIGQDTSCSYFESYQVVIPAVTQANFGYEQEYYLNSKGDTVYTGIFNFTNLSLNAVEYYWSFEDITLDPPVLGDDQKPNPEETTDESPEDVRFDSPVRTYQVTLVAIDSFGCADTLVREIDPIYFNRIHLPDIFTPDPETDPFALNNVYQVINDSEIRSFSFEVYTLNNELIVTEDENFEMLWNGTYDNQNVRNVPTGAYTIQLTVTFWDGEMKVYSKRVLLGRLGE